MSIVNLYRKDNQPFAQIPNDAIRDPRITPNAFRLLAYLMSHQDGYALTYDQIERQTTLGRYAINQAAQQLSSLGWIQVDRPKVAGRFVAKSWTVLDPSSANQSTADDSTMEQPHVEQLADIRIPITKEQQDIKNTNKIIVQNAFELFWEIYPRKDAKLEAQRKFAIALRLASAEQILDGARRYRDDPNRTKPFTKQAKAWLHQGCWNDEALPERVTTALDLKIWRDKKTEAQNEASRDSARQALAESAAAEAYAKANPAPRCVHDRIAVMCDICNKKTATLKEQKLEG